MKKSNFDLFMKTFVNTLETLNNAVAVTTVITTQLALPSSLIQAWDWYCWSKNSDSGVSDAIDSVI